MAIISSLGMLLRIPFLHQLPCYAPRGFLSVGLAYHGRRLWLVVSVWCFVLDEDDSGSSLCFLSVIYPRGEKYLGQTFHWLTHWLTDSFTHLLTHSYHSLTHSLTHSFVLLVMLADEVDRPAYGFVSGKWIFQSRHIPK